MNKFEVFSDSALILPYTNPALKLKANAFNPNTLDLVLDRSLLASGKAHLKGSTLG
jgi:hypothetical protein